MSEMFDDTSKLTKEGLNTSDKYILSLFNEEKGRESEKTFAYENINPKNLKMNKGKEMQKEKGIDKE